MRLSVHRLHHRYRMSTEPSNDHKPGCLTERGRAICTIHRLEETFRECLHLEELAPITHEILLVGDVLNPLAVVRVCCRPKCHLVELASQVYKRYRKTGLAPAF